MSKKSPTTVARVRKINEFTRLLLAVRAGGRCEFDGCNNYLFEHHVTFDAKVFGQLAHIVAFSPLGPRGDGPTRPANINDVDNLMLLCPACHKLIDDEPMRFDVITLRRYKHDHEDHIRHLTGLSPDRKTTIVQLKTLVRGQAVDIPLTAVTKAVAPQFPSDRRGTVVDLTAISDDDPNYLDTARRRIQQGVAALYDPGMDVHRTQHISLFALARIPLLIFLGSCLSNKIPVRLFQRHRDTEDWVWKDGGEPVEYRFHLLQEGIDQHKVGLLLALSGPIDLLTLPASIRDEYYLYEITLETGVPQPGFLRTEGDLLRFRGAYETARRVIARDHGAIAELHLFPAVPAPVAITCGRDLFPGVDPSLLVYDNDRARGGFVYALTINEPSRTTVSP